MRQILAVVVLLLAAHGAAAAAAEESPAKRFIERGDRFYAKRESGRKWVQKSVEFYEKALAVDPKTVEGSWKFARATYWLGTHTDDEAEKLKIFRQAIDVTKRAAAIDDKSVENHFWLGVCYAKYGEVKGIVNALSLIDPIRKVMDRVIELDPKFAGGGGYRVLGWISHKLPGVMGGSDKKAIELLEKAVEQDKGHLLNHLCLAEIHRVNDRPKQSKKHIRIILEAQVREDRRPEDLETKEAAKEMLGKIESSD